jgi:hypothetical protein
LSARVYLLLLSFSCTSKIDHCYTTTAAGVAWKLDREPNTSAAVEECSSDNNFNSIIIKISYFLVFLVADVLSCSLRSLALSLLVVFLVSGLRGLMVGLNPQLRIR